MSNRWPGGIIRKTPVVPTGPFENGTASGVWSMDQVAYWKKQGLWPTQGVQAPDPYFPYTTLLLSSTTLSNANNNLFVDSSGAFNPVSRNGNTTQGSFTPYSANWSNYFDGSGDFLSIPDNAAFDFGTGDFTIECWVYLNAYNSTFGSEIFSAHTYGISADYIFNINTTGKLFFQIGSSSSLFTSTNSVPLNAWTHIAVVRSGNTFTPYINGVNAGGAATSSSAVNASRTLTIGSDLTGNAGASLNGFISNHRVVKGTAVYTSNFTPPTAPLTAINGTSLLTCQSNRFRDASLNNFTVTSNGNTSVQDFSPFSPAYPGAVYNQSDITNWSGYFDGSGDYLSVPDNAALNMAGSTFTLECWIYPNGNYSDYRTIMSKRNASTTSYQMFLFQTTGYLSFSRANTAYQSSATPTANAWNHVAAVYDGTNINLYLNGTRVLQTAVSIADTTDPLLIGAIYTGGENFNGYISNARVLKGVQAYSGATITVPTTPLTAVSGTSLLTLQNAAFTDNSTNNFVVTPNGNPTVTGNSPFNTVGYWSNYFDGTGDYLTAPSNAAFAFGTGDYTVEAWVYPTSIRNGENLIYVTDVTQGMAFGYSQTTIYIGARATAYDLQASYTMPTNQWVHVAATRQSGTARIFVNGTQVGTGTITRSCPQGPGAVGDYPGVNEGVMGYLSNVRVVKGTALYTSNFTVPTAPLTAVSGTSLLTCQNGRFIDNSTNNFTVTPFGNTSVQSFDPFYTSTIASNGGSMYFDGSGDYLQSNQPFYALGSGDWTVDFWFYAQSNWTAATYDQIVGTIGTDASTGGWRIGSYFGGNGRTLWFTFTNGSYNDIWAAANISDGAWHHIAVVRQSGTVRLYRDGVQTASGACTVNFTKTNLLVARTEQSGYSGETQCMVSNLRVIKGTCLYPSGTTFTPPTTVQNPTPATVLALNGMNAGVYDATTISDMETIGSAQISTVQSKFGGSSIYVPSSGGCALIPNSQPLVLGTGDWTVEFWTYTDVSGSKVYFDALNAANTTFAMEIYSAGTTIYWVKPGGAVAITGTGALSANTWQHIAACKSGSSTRLFVNGTQVGSTYTDNDTYNSARWEIGGRANLTFPIVGYIDDFRITKGIARYTSNFTPPTQPFPVY